MLLAAKNLFPRTAEYLVQHGADANTGDHWRRRPLHWAAHNGGVRLLARLLFDRGAVLGKDAACQGSRGQAAQGGNAIAT